MCSEIHGPALRTLISDAQRYSYEMLIEWDEARSPDTKVPSTSEPVANLLTDNESDCLNEDASELWKDATLRDKVGMIKGYNDRMRGGGWFSQEFKAGIPESAFRQRELERVRTKATLTAYCQRIARHGYKASQEDLSPAAPAYSRGMLDPSVSLEHGPRLRSCPWLDENSRQDEYLNT